MDFLKYVRLIQGGMGVYVSNWRLAKAVAKEQPGKTVGTVSGTGLDVVYVRMLQLGDPGGHVRRALDAFDDQFGVMIGKKICNRYFIEGGKKPAARFKNSPQHIVRPQNGGNSIPSSAQEPQSVPLTLDENVVELLIATGFAEVWLAKQGHDGKIFINFLKKVELPLIYTMYGAMLAGVDGVIVGAGNPEGLPEVCSKLSNHQPVSSDLLVLYRESGESFHVPFDPRTVAAGQLARKPLQRPAFLAIVSLENLAEALAHSQTEPPDGLIIEHHTAGGHNAPPQGSLKKDNKGQPQYSDQDEPDLVAIRNAGLPFWLAGGYSSHEGLKLALAAGAVGVQIGSNFALAEESGMKPSYRTAILNELKNGVSDEDLVQTTMFSPTGFPFKVAQLHGTLAQESVYADRLRVCDIGLLQHRGLTKPAPDGTRRIFQRCPAAPVAGYLSKRGLEFNTQDKRCLCNGLLSTVGLGQIVNQNGQWFWEQLTPGVIGKSANKAVTPGSSLNQYTLFQGNKYAIAAYPSKDQMVLLVFDPQRPEIKRFSHLIYFPPDPAFAVPATLEKFPKITKMTMLTSRNLEKTFYRYATIHFTLENKELQLTAFKYAISPTILLSSTSFLCQCALLPFCNRCAAARRFLLTVRGRFGFSFTTSPVTICRRPFRKMLIFLGSNLYPLVRRTFFTNGIILWVFPSPEKVRSSA